MTSSWRHLVLFVFVVGLFGAVAVKLFYLQIICHQKYVALAEAQHWVTSEIFAKRGEILTRDGFPLAANQQAFLLYAEPKKIADKRKTIEAILPSITEELMSSPSAKADRSYIFQATTVLVDHLESGLSWVSLAHKLPVEKKTSLEKLSLPGLGFEEESKRFYPEQTLASHLLGFVASDERGQDKGYFGLEGFYDGHLRGRSGWVKEEKNSWGEPLLLGEFQKIPPLEGQDLVLTVNHATQFLVEEKLRQAVVETGASAGTVIIQNPKTGEIIALANFPNFNPGDWRETSGGSETREASVGATLVEGKVERRNLAIAATYEPGSVIKALTMSAGIEEKKITPQTSFNDDGPLYVGGYKIDTWNFQHHGSETMTQVLINSCNIGAAWVSRLLGVEKLVPYFEKFNFSSRLGLDLEGEDTGVIKSIGEWGETELATAAFGQGISATPLQVLEIFSTLANDGVLFKPYVVEKIVNQDREIKTKPRAIRRVVSVKTAKTMVEMLTQVVEKSKSPNYTLRDRYVIAGKTGTAQIPEGGTYDPNKTNTTFVGFLPAQPEFVMLVKLEQPKTSPYAEVVAVPLWMEIAKELVLQMGIPPDR